MSFITPITVGDFPRSTRPFSNVQPFTYRDGSTYLEILEGLRSWLRDTLVPHLNTELGEVNEAWTREVTALTLAVDTALSTQAAEVTEALVAQAADITAKADAWMSTQISNNDVITRAILDDATTETSKYVANRTPLVFHGDGTADQTIALQAFFDALPVGRNVELRGTINFTTLALNVRGIHVWMSPGTMLRKIESASDGITVNAADCVIEGGTIESPTAWDGTNTAWLYAVIHVKDGANNVTVRGVTLNNVHKVGIGVRSDGVNITDCRIVGNYPAAQWTGVETAHFGITFDPTTQGTGGAGIVSNNHIRSCVQGAHIGNYGASTETGFTITGNHFHGCHNHGIYAQTGSGNTITGNVFHNCQIPVVITGKAHVVTANTMYVTSTGGNLEKTGISVRDAIGCIVEGNTIFGDSTSANVGIALDALSGTEVSNNVVRGNVLILNGSGNAAIRLGASAQTCRDNLIDGNIVRGGGLLNGGVILVTMASAAYTGRGNVVSNNRVTMLHNAHGIYVAYQEHFKLSDNFVETVYSATATVTLIQLYLVSVDKSVVSGNVLTNPATHGTNVALRAIQEDMNSDGNVFAANVVKHETALLTSSTPLMIQNVASTSMTDELIGRYAAATTLGTLSGKMEVRGPGGTVRGFVPVYTTIS